MLPFITASVFASCAQERYYREAEALTAALRLEQKVGQMVMVGVPGSRMNRKAESIITENLPGGIILFGRNLTTFGNNRAFVTDLHDASIRNSGIPLFISIDQEGGRVVRIRSGVTQFPGNMAAGISGDCGLVYEWGRILGLELRRSGVNMNLAPVLDVNNNPSNPVINTRSFGSDPRLVADIGACYVRGIQDSRCISVGKHFPGHGDTDSDSHYTLPVIRSSMKRLGRIELVPFQKAIAAGVECIMSAHLSYPLILGNGDPATISPLFLTRLLREELKFNGLIITDDLEMAAISSREELGEAAVRSILAGADIVLLSSYGSDLQVIVSAIKRAVALKRISAERINESVKRILEAKIRYGIMTYEEGRIGAGRFIMTDDGEKILGSAGRVNSELSRTGLIYFGDIKLLYPGENAARIFITSSPRLREILAGKKRNVLCSFPGLQRCTARGGKIILYLHVVEPDLNYIKTVAGYCKKRGIDLVVISSGNPFPLAASGIVKAGLLSFSDTDESLRQLGLCLNGRFRPKLDAGLDLGIKK